MSTPQRSPVEAKVGGISDQERALATGNQATAQGTLSQFEGPVDKSPFYKSMLKAGTEGTADAYQSAKANTAARAKNAGFGYAQPVAQGAQSQVDAAEAKTMSEVPGKALTAASGQALTAAGETAGIGATQSGAGTTYSGQQVDLEKQYQQQLAAQQQAMWKAISDAGSTAMMFA